MDPQEIQGDELSDRDAVGAGGLQRDEGFGEAGQLLLRQADGTVKEVWSGDVGLGEG